MTNVNVPDWNMTNVNVPDWNMTNVNVPDWNMTNVNAPDWNMTNVNVPDYIFRLKLQWIIRLILKENIHTENFKIIFVVKRGSF